MKMELKSLQFKFCKENVSFEDLKISILKRLGNVDSVNRDNSVKPYIKDVVKQAKATDKLVYLINMTTEFQMNIVEG